MPTYTTRPTKSVHALRSTTPARTYEQGPAFALDDKTALYLAAVTTMSTDSFYESATKRESRLHGLLRSVARTDPDWLARFVPWLRNEAGMRTASIVVAAEGLRYGAFGADVLSQSMQRADEPAEMLAYWKSTHGSMPHAVRRGVAAAATRLYNEYTAQKYYRTGSWDMADVLQLTHARPVDAQQSALFKYLLDRKYTGIADLSLLPMTDADTWLQAIPTESRHGLLQDSELFERAGWTWERMSGWTTMDAAAWEAIIPQMGYMALLRNLRNFSEAGISQSARQQVINVLTDPDRVAASKQFPYRFYSAWKANKANFEWVAPLEQALQLSMRNVPVLSGRTLVAVDVSASMTWGEGRTPPAEIAGLFGAALAKTNDVDLFAYADTAVQVPYKRTDATLEIARRIGAVSVGHGTSIGSALKHVQSSHTRIVILSDMQMADRTRIADDKYVYSFDLSGYGTTPIPTNNRRFVLGGWSDAAWRLMPAAERQTWPF